MVVQQVLRLTLRDAFFSIGGSALFTHLIFNRFEPLQLYIWIVFLILIPATLSMLLWTHFFLPIAVGLTFITYYATLLTSISLYRLSPFHPLARYPGPTKLKLSSIFVFQMSMPGHRPKYFRKLHEEYHSDVIRIGPNELSFRDATAIGPIMGTNGLPKGPGYDGRCCFRTHRNLLTWRDNSMHAKRRKPWGRGTNTAAVKDYEPVIAGRAAQLVDLLLRRRDGVVNLSECIAFFAYDFMGDMAFGGGSELMRDGDTQGAFHNMDTAIKAGMLLEAFPWFAYNVQLVPSVSAKFRQLRDAGAVRAKERIAKGAMVKDLFHYLNNDDEADAASPSIDAVAAEGALVILAGSDTTSSVLSTLMYLLMLHPDVYKKVQQEIDKFYPPGENALDTKHHSDLQYLDAVINETLRLYPVQPSGSQRATHEQGLLIGPHYVPPHTSVRINTFAIHRDLRYFSPNPDVFWPERWLIAEDPASYHSQSKTPFIHNVNAFIPFSFGPNNCVGKNLALKEMKMVLTHMVQQVEVRFAEGYDPNEYERDMKDWFAVQVGKLPVVVSTRHAKA